MFERRESLSGEYRVNARIVASDVADNPRELIIALKLSAGCLSPTVILVHWARARRCTPPGNWDGFLKEESFCLSRRAWAKFLMKRK
ncbi:hypothetical protein CEXT_291791 [Caerostris extrusa]|uniref:Uncharacterized protein n=1 Tax=Caerostris extrusa TaxID=172846 RepID=A0AAV4YD18_CAEEX|nr:hypothetical protein CEXT_291791 [Caerostris extrusa]